MTAASPIYGDAGTPDTARYPIGPLVPKETLTAEERSREIARIAAAPARLRKAVEGLRDDQLDNAYRPGGWTLRQVVHHLADSHMNAYIRLRLALTESNPTIKPYDESAWAELDDARTLPVEPSLILMEKLHERFVSLLRALSPDMFLRTFYHPEHKRSLSIDGLVSMYAWHGDHHVAHVEMVRKRDGDR